MNDFQHALYRPETAAHSDLAHLYEQYRRPLMAHLMRLVQDVDVAEDLCQETFVKALRNWHQHDPRSSVSAWIYRIATNTAYDYLRRLRCIRFTPLRDTETEANELSAVESRVDAQGALTAALAQLPAPYRDLLLLHAGGDQTTQELANALGCSHSAAKTRLFRARARFREVYQG